MYRYVLRELIEKIKILFLRIWDKDFNYHCLLNSGPLDRKFYYLCV